jgi:hypothetical protein
LFVHHAIFHHPEEFLRAIADALPPNSDAVKQISQSHSAVFPSSLSCRIIHCMQVAKAKVCLNTGFSSQLEKARKRGVSNGRRSVGKWTDNIRFVMITMGCSERR